ETLLAQAQGFLDGDLVERVHRHLDVGKLDPGLVRLDADFDVVIDDPFDRDQRFHRTLTGMPRGMAAESCTQPPPTQDPRRQEPGLAAPSPPPPPPRR